MEWNMEKAENLCWMFYMCSALKNLHGLEKWKTSKVIYLAKTFGKCTGLENIDALKNWDTKNVRQIDYMFFQCPKLPHIHAIDNWNLKNCTIYKGLVGGTKMEKKDLPNNVKEKSDIFCKDLDWDDED